MIMIFLSAISYSQLSAQLGCTDDLACNYDAGAVTDDGSCTYSGIFIPVNVFDGPAVRACAGLEPDGYYFANQACAETVVAADPFCIDPTGSWDSLCENAYNDCLGCASPEWYLPYDINNSQPMVEACSPPAGYYLASDQACAWDRVLDDSYCVRQNWDYFCQNEYDLCAFGCLGAWYIPVLTGSGPAIYDCNAPVGYILADESCIEEVIAADDFCVFNSFDPLCEEAYSNCLLGCDEGAWYLPYQVNAGLAPQFACSAPAGYYAADETCLSQVEIAIAGAVTSPWTSAAQDEYTNCTLGCTSAQYWIPYEVSSGPAIFDCTDPGEAYYAGDQACIQEVIANDPFCLETFWDILCQEAYNTCALGCADAQWHIPVLVSSSQPAVFSCFPPSGYWTPNQACVTNVIANDDFCVDTEWDFFCQSDYNTCAYGCSNAEWYIPETPGSGPAILECTPPAGYVLPESLECFLSVVDTDDFCISPEGQWDSICQDAYDDCTNGCTYSFACNYDPNAIFDDGSCSGYPGCTDPTATNFDANATCDNGLCTYDGVTSCPGDLDGNAVVNANDLLGFLAAFGTTCP